ncbi:MAG: hypothetical protein HDS35_06615 [Bacteroides sp.]|nr:hypothetical protein [Bacteroides sp.]
MGKPEPLYKALGVSSLMLGIGAVLSGNAAAQVHGNAEFFPATICLLFVIFTQLAANAYHRYHALLVLKGLTPDSVVRLSGSRGGNDQLLFYRVFSFGLGILALMTGLTLVAMGGFWFGAIGVFILIASWMLVGGNSPLLLSTWGFGFTFIMFGPVAVISTSLLQSSHESTDPLNWFDISPAIFMSVVVGFMAANAYLAFVYASYFRSKKMMRFTFTALYGRRATRITYLCFGLVASGLYIWSCFAIGLDKPWFAVVPGLICLGFDIYIWRKMKTSPRHRLASVAELSCLNVLLMGIISSILSIWIGIPDDSKLQIF